MIETVSPTMADLQEAAGAWHLATFGEGDFAAKIGRKLGEEVAELNQAIGAMDSYDRDDEGHTEALYEQVNPELGDVGIAWLALSHRLGVDAFAAVEGKLAELGTRTANGEYAGGRRR